MFTASMALVCGACATTDSDGDRVGSPEAANPYGVYVPPNVQQQAFAQSYSVPYVSPAAQAPAPMPLAQSTATAPNASPPDPGLYAGDQGFSPWPGANGPSWSVQASGNLANAREVVAGMAEAFKRCYNRALQDDPNVMGRARLTAKIGPDGRVVSVSPSTVAGLPGNMVVCVMMVVKSAQFGVPNGGGATIVIPVSFVTQ